MAFPLSDLSTVTVTGRYLDFQGRAASGTVTFTPKSAARAVAGDVILLPERIVVDLDQHGSVEVVLPIGDDPQYEPQFVYQVDEKITGGLGRSRFYIQLKMLNVGHPYDLIAATPVQLGEPINEYYPRAGGAIEGDASVDGDFEVQEDLTVNGDTEVQNLKINGTLDYAGGGGGGGGVGPITGTTLAVSSTSTLTGNVAAGANLSVTGTSSHTGNATFAGNAAVTGTLGVTGATTVHDFTAIGNVSLGPFVGTVTAPAFANTFGGTFVPTRVFSVTKAAINRNGTKTGGGTSDSAAIQSVINECGAAGGGRVLLPAGGYKLTTALTNTYSNVILCGEGAGATVLWHNIPSTSFTFVYRSRGTFGPVLASPTSTLAADAAWDPGNLTNSVTVTVTSAAGISAGDYIMIGDSYDEELDANGWFDRYRGEFARVKSIAGNVLTLWSQLRDDYTTARTAGMWKPTLIAGSGVEDLSIIAADGIQSTTRTGGIQFSASQGNHISGVEIAGMDDSGINVAYTIDSEIRDSVIRDLSNSSPRLGYNISIGPSEGTYITGNLLKNGRHGVTTGGANSFVGWARGITVTGNRFVGSDAAAIDSHPATTDMVISGNHVDRCKDIGISIRSGRTTVSGNTINRAGATGINIDRKAAIETNIVDNVIDHAGNYGIAFVGNMTPNATTGFVDGFPDRSLILNNQIRESWNEGVRCTGPVAGLEIIGNNFRYCGRANSPTPGATTFAISLNVSNPSITGMRILGNRATGVNACVGTSGGTVTTSIFVGNELYSGVGSAPAAVKGGAITGEATNTVANNGEYATSSPGNTRMNQVFLANQSAPATPSGGGVLYVESGALKYKGSSGTVSTVASA